MIGVGLADGVSEIDVAAVAETYSGASSAARALPIGLKPTITTRHGLVLLVQPVAAAPRVDRIVIPSATSTADVNPQLLQWAADHGVDVELPTRGTPSAFGFDPILRDLAQHADRATALTTAKRIEYPTAHLALTGPAWPWRPMVLLGVALLLSSSLGILAGRSLQLSRRSASFRSRPDLLVDRARRRGRGVVTPTMRS